MWMNQHQSFDVKIWFSQLIFVWIFLWQFSDFTFFKHRGINIWSKIDHFLDLDFKPLGLLHEASRKMIHLKRKEDFKAGECYRIIGKKTDVPKVVNPWESNTVEEVTQVFVV